MQKGMMRALLFAGVLALGACSGDDGSTGATGPVGPAGAAGQDGNDGAPGANGQDLVATAKAESCATCHPGVGTEHQAIYKTIWDAPILAATVGTVSYDATAQQVTVNFSLTKNGAPYAADVTKFGQKTVYVAKYDRATRKFGSYKSLSVLAPGATAGTYTAKNDIVGKPTATPPVAPTLVDYDPTTSDAFVYVYFAENPTVLPAKGNYKLYADVASAAKQFSATAEPWSYVTATKSSNCEKCHPAPYMKHGYRAGAVAGIDDMVACKACHGDARNGTHPDWQVIVTDPLRYTQLAATPMTAAEKAKYAYVASVMNDTHMSHAMEFAYPQSMANCVTCHEGRLTQILTDDFFTLATCKSCHPFTTTAQDAKRAPALQPLMTAGALGTVHNMAADLYSYTGTCNTCHKTGGFARSLDKIHTGYSKVIYSDTAGTKFSSSIQANLGAVTFDSATKKLTIPFTVTGASANAIIKPTVVISLYGYDTKDFIVGGHASQPAPDGKRNLEWTEGASGNSPRLTVTPATATAGNATWTATADLSLWANLLANGTVKRAEIGILPALGVDQTKAPNNSATTTTNGVTSANPNYNPYLAVAGVAKTFDLVGNAIVADADAYGKDIVDPAKCNDCHDALGTTFHSPAYGSAGVVGCRLCHVVGSGGSHLEMQSRSIDSYIHAIHSMQPFDIGDVDFADPVEAMHFEHHVESTYPNFTTLNCESCHNAGKYDVPDQSKSMPGIISASDTLKGADRAIGTVPSYVTGPASRACGGCHRAQMVNEDDAGRLASFNGHTAAFGTHLENKTGVFDSAVEKVMSLFK